jgi:hypothetical protein
MLAQLLGVQVGEETIRRLTEQAGRLAEAAQTAAAKEPWKEEVNQRRGPIRLATSADGAYVPLINGEWAEVRTLAIGIIGSPHSSKNPSENLVSDLSYFSRKTDAETFTQLAEVEMRQRHVLDAEQVCAVTDGADWLQHFFDVHRTDAVRILDFPHAAEHLSALLEAGEKAGLRFPPQMLKRSLPILKHRGPSWLLRLADRFPKELSEQDGIREHLGYLRKRETLMDYPHFRAAGWPIGSGMVESANKLVVQARLKGAGMHWAGHNVNPMLALRNGVCNERWSHTWQLANQQRHQQTREHRKLRAQHHRLTKLASHDPLLLESPPRPPQPTIPHGAPLHSISAQPAATLPGSSRPSPHHPWKRGSACAPRNFAKI